MKRVAAAIGIAVAVVLLVVLWAAAALSPPPKATGKALVRIWQAASAQQVARVLKRKGIIRNQRLFALVSRARGLDRKFKSGWHLLPRDLSALKVMEGLAQDKFRAPAIEVTVPEGLTIKEQAQVFEKAGLCPAAKFVERAGKPSTFAGAVKFPLPPDSLEGYLFPDTYLFDRGTSPEKMMETMLRTFESKGHRPLAEAIAAAPLGLHGSVILASLVEAEAKAPGERPTIAGVYVNRLRMGMRLECDATVQYALGARKPRLLYSDLRVASPYNTYLHPGLPPGPICNPGRASIEAALRPAAVPYLYYVARGDGTHVFSRTFGEHQRAIRAVRGQ